MIKVAIVGNIASGKSEMEKILEKRNYVVLDTDLMTHDILIDRPEVAKAFSDYDISLEKLDGAEPEIIDLV